MMIMMMMMMMLTMRVVVVVVVTVEQQVEFFASETEVCKVRGFHGSGYEECRLLGYKTPVRT
jgi:hypothetical protein